MDVVENGNPDVSGVAVTFATPAAGRRRSKVETFSGSSSVGFEASVVASLCGGDAAVSEGLTSQVGGPALLRLIPSACAVDVVLKVSGRAIASAAL